MVQVLLDADGYFTGNYATVGTLDGGIEVDTLPDESDNVKCKCYKLVEGVWVFDEDKYKSLLETTKKTLQMSKVKKAIAQLQNLLSETDYKVIKCYEYNLAGQPMPYDVVALHEERQSIRDEINALEESLK